MCFLCSLSYCCISPRCMWAFYLLSILSQSLSSLLSSSRVFTCYILRVLFRPWINSPGISSETPSSRPSSVPSLNSHLSSFQSVAFSLSHPVACVTCWISVVFACFISSTTFYFAVFFVIFSFSHPPILWSDLCAFCCLWSDSSSLWTAAVIHIFANLAKLSLSLFLSVSLCLSRPQCFVQQLDGFISWLQEALDSTENWTQPRQDLDSLRVYLDTHLVRACDTCWHNGLLKPLILTSKMSNSILNLILTLTSKNPETNS